MTSTLDAPAHRDSRRPARGVQSTTAWRAGVALTPEVGDTDAVRIATPQWATVVRAVGPGGHAAFRALADEPTEDDLLAEVARAGGESALLGWHLQRRRLDALGALERAVRVDGEEVARVRVIGRDRMGPVSRPSSTSAWVLAADVVLTADPARPGRLVGRRPERGLVVDLAGGALPALTAFGTPATVEAADVPPELVALLGAAGILVPADTVAASNDSDAPLWGDPEWWLHTHSRMPRTVPGYGGTYRTRDTVKPEPLAATALSTDRLELTVPDLEARAATDPSLSATVEGRRSRREHDPQNPVTLDQLAELLYRTVRVRRTFVGADGQELADKPIPSGGAVHELEIYPLVTQVDGLDPALYRYDAIGHALERAPATDAGNNALTNLVAGARASALMAADPQVVLLVSARFGRVMWKYESVAYALTLKHVGVLYQTVYLVGEAMGLAVCGLGGGDTAAFAAATGRDPRVEGTVGELVVGSRGTP